MNIFKVVQKFAATDKTLPVLNAVHFTDSYVYATNRYVLVKADVSHFGFVVSEPVAVPLATVKEAAKVKSGLTNVDNNILTFEDGRTLPFVPVEGVLPPFEKLLTEFTPSDSVDTSRCGFNPKFLALFADWSKSEPVRLEFDEKGQQMKVSNSDGSLEALVMGMRL